MEDVINLSPGKLQFIEDMGLYFEQYGVARIGGRVLALLVLADRPLTLDAMAATLGVARSSISTNVRVNMSGGMVERVSFPGDRRDYYRLTANTWDSAANATIERILSLRRMTEHGLAALAPDDEAARARLAELLSYCEFMAAEQQASLARWRQRRGAAAEAALPVLDGIGRQL